MDLHSRGMRWFTQSRKAWVTIVAELLGMHIRGTPGVTQSRNTWGYSRGTRGFTHSRNARVS